MILSWSGRFNCPYEKLYMHKSHALGKRVPTINRISPETSHFYRKFFYLRGYGVAIFCQMG
ncbi:MAG: hypothetical protein ACNYPD_07755 [Candidatus Halichondribacter symbioticus]